MELHDDIASRRSFAIISHPDAGKTTLTEKLLLFGGAVNLAGEVKARGERRRSRSDWLKVEQQRGISVASSVMTFPWRAHTFNLLDTPGHEDFSEDTYRVLSAVDSAVMVLDAAKGIESQTLKLFEVCRLRDMPIMTFINKLDRESRDPFDLLDEIEQRLALDVAPVTWPIGTGRRFQGCYDLRNDRVILLDTADKAIRGESTVISGLDSPELANHIGKEARDELADQVEMVRGLTKPFDRQAYREGHMTPVFFGSALISFGVRELLEGLAEFAPPPRAYPATERWVSPGEERLSGFIFKIQANMDARHRDRMAFLRLVSGRFTRGMKLRHVRSGKTVALHNAQTFLAQSRDRTEEAVAGDVIGLPNHGGYKIGDSLTEGESLHFLGVPSFAPELLQRVRPDDPMKAKHLSRALEQLAEEGAARVFKPHMGGSEWIVGVVGGLQFDILADRIRNEFNVPVRFEPTELMTARWLECTDSRMMKRFIEANRSSVASDHTGQPVYLARNTWHLNKGAEDWPDMRFLKTKEEAA